MPRNFEGDTLEIGRRAILVDVIDVGAILRMRPEEAAIFRPRQCFKQNSRLWADLFQ